MSETKSLLRLEAENCRPVPMARGTAKVILDRMNGMLRDRSFFEVCDDWRYTRLNERLHALGWLGMIETFTRRDGKWYAQLKLVDPKSEEARRLM